MRGGEFWFLSVSTSVVNIKSAAVSSLFHLPVMTLKCQPYLLKSEGIDKLPAITKGSIMPEIFRGS